MKKDTQIALLAALTGFSLSIMFSIWLDAGNLVSDRFVPAVVASLTALIIAFVVYPWQKNKDRQFQIRAERRELYRAFVSGWVGIERGFSDLLKSNDIDEVLPKMFELTDKADELITPVFLGASAKRAADLTSLHDELYLIIDKVSEAVGELAKDASESTVSRQYAISRVVDDLRKTRDKRLARFGEVLQGMRREEFDDTSKITFGPRGGIDQKLLKNS